MTCCGGKSRPKVVRKQASAKPYRHRAKTRVKPISMIRQYSIPKQRCPKCGHMMSMVNIANRERMRCTNIECRYVSR